MTQKELKQHLHYDPKTGIFTRKIHLSTRKSLDRVGTIDESGYVHIRINYTRYLGHRLAFLYMVGSMPKYVDHKDGNPSNNKWNNLRKATIKQNNRNRLKGIKYKGVRRRNFKIGIKYEAYIKINGKQIYLGLFLTEIGAAKAYDKAAIKLFGEYSSLNFQDTK